MSESPTLYHPDILRLSKSSPGFDKNGTGNTTCNAINQVCGDKYVLCFDLDHNFHNLSFHGYGCAVSKASTALLIQRMQGRNPAELGALCRAFIGFVRGEIASPPLEELEIFRPLRDYPARLKCGILSWEAILVHCEGYPDSQAESP